MADDDVALRHLAGAVDDAGIDDGERRPFGDRLAGAAVGESLGALVVVDPDAVAHLRGFVELAARAAFGGTEGDEARHVDDPLTIARLLGGGEDVLQAADVDAVELRPPERGS